MLIPRSNVVAVSPAAGVVKDGVSRLTEKNRRYRTASNSQEHRTHYLDAFRCFGHVMIISACDHATFPLNSTHTCAIIQRSSHFKGPEGRSCQ